MRDAQSVVLMLGCKSAQHDAWAAFTLVGDPVTGKSFYSRRPPARKTLPPGRIRNFDAVDGRNTGDGELTAIFLEPKSGEERAWPRESRTCHGLPRREGWTKNTDRDSDFRCSSSERWDGKETGATSSLHR